MLIERLKAMFAEMVVKKDATRIAEYYHPEFLLYSNGKTTDYSGFLASHQGYYATLLQYDVKYDEETLFEQGDKVAARVWITISVPDEEARMIEVILIAQFNGDKLYRLWETTYPDWSTFAELKHPTYE